jgi:hypothetical protein
LTTGSSGEKALKLLGHLGLIEIEPGPRLVNVFRFSNASARSRR